MKTALAAVIAGLVLALAGGWLALADQGRVTGTPHDVAAHGAGAVSSCETCHIPHEASGEALWDGDPREGDGFSGAEPVCYSCHDGTIASGAFVFDPETVRHPIDRDGGEDCDMCHDPHVYDYGNFLTFPSGANLCQACHESAGGSDHPVNVNVHEAGFDPLDTEWGPDEGDTHGTRLWDPSGRPAGEYLKCLSCHAAHGGSTDSLLATEDTSGSAPAFCANCHNGEAVR
jgi:predicted CXXCH cytochrome family protein